LIAFNTLPEHGCPLYPVDADTLGMEGARAALDYWSRQDDYRPTPLHALPALAATLGVASIHVKDEAHRLGLGSFKALGGCYAAVRLVLDEVGDRLGRTVTFDDLSNETVREVTHGLTLTCATDGNHGRSVARGAQLCGAQAVIFVHGGVSQPRIQAIQSLGSRVETLPGTYDDAVKTATQIANKRGWLLVSDTSGPGYETTPALVMQGYTVLVREVLDALSNTPTHVFLQAGVGGMAAAISGHLAAVHGSRRPGIFVVEPDRADCLHQSLHASRPMRIRPGDATLMAMLECYEPSWLAWRVLSRTADAFVTIGDDEAVTAMNAFAKPIGNDPPIVSGESGGAGLAGLMQVARDSSSRARLRLDAGARVLLINTEGATDPARYRELVKTAGSLEVL
jgi:diaminopropionate ammonia-lyase